jgi:hypothetical protein
MQNILQFSLMDVWVDGNGVETHSSAQECFGSLYGRKVHDRKEISRYSSQYSARLSAHPNDLVVNLIAEPDKTGDYEGTCQMKCLPDS